MPITQVVCYAFAIPQRDTLMSQQDEHEFNDFEAYCLGFTAAVAVAPQPTPPSRWILPLSDQFESRGKSDFKLLAVDLLELGEFQMEGLLTANWQPVIATNKDARTATALPCAVWAQGFFNATNVADLGWPQADALKAEAQQALTPIVACSGAFPELSAEFKSAAGENAEEIAETLAFSVVALKSLHLGPWLNEGAPPAGAPKADRNAPCPCGSGKPYKACCSPVKLVP